MSGGVDSSVAALLLKEQGYEVIGVTMQIWQDEAEETREENGGCCGLSAVDDARRVAEKLDIPYYVMNFKKEFRKYVMDYFTAEYGSFFIQSFSKAIRIIFFKFFNRVIAEFCAQPFSIFKKASNLEIKLASKLFRAISDN